jgi:hypothetical protein
MPNLPIKKLSIEEANHSLQVDFDQNYWKFLVKQINYREIHFEQGAIVFPPFIPFEEVVKEILQEIKDGEIETACCQVCQSYFNINQEDGIFGDPQNLDRFICKDCSLKISAREFYENHLKM